MQPQIETAGASAARRISMGIGKSVIIDLPEDAAEIFVGNPKVANAVVRSARKLYIIGIADGQTTVFALDFQGRQIAALEISIGRDVGELQQILNAALPDSQIVTRTINDTIILNGTVNSPEEAQRATDIAEGFVKQAGQAAAGQSLVVNSLVIRGRDQVMLKVSVAEIRRDIGKQLGITSSVWGSFTQYNPFGIDIIAANPSTGLPTSLTVHNQSNTVSATLQAFERYGVSRILAEPTVTAISGESAKFTVGGQVPIPSAPVCTTNGSVTNCSPGGVSYQSYGVSLEFLAGRPLGRTEYAAYRDRSHRARFSDRGDDPGRHRPGLRARKNETTVEVPSGGSIASAGFLQTTSQQVINGLPGAIDMPILGTLFRSRDYQRNETELMIIITPYLMKATEANALPKPDDGFANSSDPQAWLLGRINRLYASPNNPESLKNFNAHVGFIQD